MITHLSSNIFQILKEQEKPKDYFVAQVVQLFPDPEKQNLLKIQISDGVYLQSFFCLPTILEKVKTEVQPGSIIRFQGVYNNNNCFYLLTQFEPIYRKCP